MKDVNSQSVYFIFEGNDGIWKVCVCVLLKVNSEGTYEKVCISPTMW